MLPTATRVNLIIILSSLVRVMDSIFKLLIFCIWYETAISAE